MERKGGRERESDRQTERQREREREQICTARAFHAHNHLTWGLTREALQKGNDQYS